MRVGVQVEGHCASPVCPLLALPCVCGKPSCAKLRSHL